MSNNFFEKIKKNRSLLILALIILVGIFLRTYHFKDWLYFYPDQARDAMIAENVANGTTDWPLQGAIAASTPFRIGPFYYYFQIISAKIFGAGPEKMAYPDLFFGILSIPLLYYFLRGLFNSNISLAMAGLYSISFFVIRYSRFAWNPNPMPFFVILFLIAFSEFLQNKEKTKWRWIALTGITIGIGMQLHTILFLLLPTITFLAFVYLLIKNPRVWKKIAMIIVIALFLNTAQIISETKTNFANTLLLFNLSAGASENGKNDFLKYFEKDILCNAQANTFALSSLGDKDSCNFSQSIKRIIKNPHNFDYESVLFIAGVMASVAFLFLGFASLLYYYRKEKDTKKKFLSILTITFFGLSFLIMFPVIDGISLRYFLYLLFLPFVLLAFILKFLTEKYPKVGGILSVLIVLTLIISNLATIGLEAKIHFEKRKSTSTYVVLGELEGMSVYIFSQSFPQNSASLVGKSKFVQNYFKPLDYLLNKQGIDLLHTSEEERIGPNTPKFYIGPALDGSFLKKNGDIKEYKNFGQVGIYKIEGK